MQENYNCYPLLWYCWKYRLFGTTMRTTTGKDVEVIDPGLFDRRHGHSFFNAKVRIDGLLQVGSVLTVNTSHDFYESCGDYEKESTNVILVVCNAETGQCHNANGGFLPVVEVEIPDKVQRNYDMLLSEGIHHCHHRLRNIKPLTYHAWLSALQTEHLEQETERISGYRGYYLDDWQTIYGRQMFRAFGLGVNEDVMEKVYASIPKAFWESWHFNDLFQVEAVVFGQAGLLDPDTLPDEHREKALMEGYFTKLRNEWLYLAHKYQMAKSPRYAWRPMGKGRGIPPHVTLSQLTKLLYMRKADLPRLVEVKSVVGLFELTSTNATPYWEMHFDFGRMTERSDKPLTRDRQSRIVMGCHIPMLFAYGRHTKNEALCDMAFELMEQMKPYQTRETAWFQRFGIVPKSAGDSVALCQLKGYCDRRDCLRCRFGYEFIKDYEPIK